MKRKKWYKYKNSETGHVIHSPILPEDMTSSEGDTYYELQMPRDGKEDEK